MDKLPNNYSIEKLNRNVNTVTIFIEKIYRNLMWSGNKYEEHEIYEIHCILEEHLDTLKGIDEILADRKADLNSDDDDNLDGMPF